MMSLQTLEVHRMSILLSQHICIANIQNRNQVARILFLNGKSGSIKTMEPSVSARCSLETISSSWNRSILDQDKEDNR